MEPTTPLSRQAAGLTVPQSAFSPAGLAAYAVAPDGADGQAPAAVGEPVLAGESAEARLGRAGIIPAPADAARRRFAIEGVLGAGATARVYAVVDRNLDRPVAVKVMAADGQPAPGDVASFLAEARITASLSHPNVLPVHELDVDDAGRVWFTMKKIDGRSLEDAIDRSTAGARDSAVAGANAVATIVIAVAQALAYAHARRIVHQDVKPSNIMLGDFGEVLLVDWGSAARLAPGTRPRLYGTPLYMSPEQAREDGVDERSDVYCLGATLFHALLLRVPTWHDDPEEFWHRKRAGVLDAPTPAERAGVPPALLDIALKALSADPAARYADADAMLRDLRAFQAGLAVSAHREGALARLRRWHARHARTLWSAVAVAAVVLSLVGALYGERLKELATWGQPIVAEEFDAGWEARWLPYEGAFEGRDGRIVSSAPNASSVFFGRKLWGPVAIEYEAELTPGSRACDLSLLWVRDVDRSEDGARVTGVHDAYQLQFGAYDGSYTTIRRPGTDGQHLACGDAYPRSGIRHRVRVEVEDQRLSLWIDGRLECEWEDPVRFDGGWFALYGHYPGKAFDAVRVFQRGVPQKVPITAVGDAFLRAGDLDQAAQQFARVVASHPGTALGREALYKQGLCRWRQERHDEAEALWAPLDAPGADALLGERVRLHRLERVIAGGDHAAILAAMEDLGRGASPIGRKLLAMRWAPYADEQRRAGRRDAVEQLVDLFDRHLAHEKTADASAAQALYTLGRNRELIERFPRQRLTHTMAWEALGRVDVVVDQYQDQLRRWETACFTSGCSERIDPASNPGLHAIGMAKRGLHEEVIARYTGHPDGDLAVFFARLTLGRFDELRSETDGWRRTIVLLHQGRLDEALAMPGGPEPIARLCAGDPAPAIALGDVHRPDLASRARHLLALDAWAAGRRDEAEAALAGCHGGGDWGEDTSLIHGVAFALLRAAVGGSWEAFDRAVEAHGADRWRAEQKAWHDARYLRGEIDDGAILSQPHAGWTGPRLLLLRAMRHERHGRAAEALADYRAFLATPTWTRGPEPEPATTRFAEMRAQALAEP